MVCSSDRGIWKCPWKLFKKFFGCQLDPERASPPPLLSTETSGICTGNGIHMMKSLQKTTLSHKAKDSSLN